MHLVVDGEDDLLVGIHLGDGEAGGKRRGEPLEAWHLKGGGGVAQQRSETAEGARHGGVRRCEAV